jgi:D-alanine-D-alanine ligase
VKFGLTYTARLAASEFAVSQPDDAEEEFDSPETIAAIAAALRSLGHEVELLGDGPSLARRLVSAPPPEFIFNIAEGRGIGRSREAWTPALLETFGVPYTGSDPLTLAATLDKDCAKRLVASAGVAVPSGVLIKDAPQDSAEELANLELPLIVKPAFEGSSKGIRSRNLVNSRDELFEIVAACRDAYEQSVLVEEFIDGDELTVGMVGNSPPEILSIMRVVPLSSDKPFVYSLEVKRDWRRQVRYETPAKLSAADDLAVRLAALSAFKSLGCHDVARIDFRLRRSVPYFLEANPLPGLTPGSSDLVLLAEAVGIGYCDLIGHIVDAAISRHSRESIVAAVS